MGRSEAVTGGIRVEVEADYWPERSQPQAGRFAFAYRVRIQNVGSEPATLQSRHWLITDAAGRVEDVRGEGVVGKQPRLGPGQAFEYASWAQLRTPYGAMRGSYEMERPDGSTFDAEVAEFSLTQPNALN
jgi:ApaG protein